MTIKDKALTLASLLILVSLALTLPLQAQTLITDLAVIDCVEPVHIAPSAPFTPWSMIKNNGIIVRTAKANMHIYRNDILIEAWPSFSVAPLLPGDSLLVEFPTLFPNWANALYRLEFSVDCFPFEDEFPEDNYLETRVYTWDVAKQRVLLELATGVYGSLFDDCYGAVAALDGFSEDQLAILNHHYFPPYANDDSEARIAHLGITEYPTAVFDASVVLTDASSTESLYPTYQAAYNSLLPKKAPVELTIRGESIASLYDFTVYIDRIAYLEETEWQLFLAITEDGLPVDWMGYSALDNVTRYILPSPTAGQAIGFDGSNPAYISASFQLQLDSYINPAACNLVAWLEDPVTGEVIQANSIPLSQMLPPLSNNVSEIAPSIQVLSSYPNPFSSQVSISIEKREPGTAQLEIFNLRGQRLHTQSLDQVPVGEHNLTWQAEDSLPSGVYFIRLQSGDSVSQHRMLLIR